MGAVTVTERIYVDDKGRPVPENNPRAARLAAVPGDELTEEQAAALGVKAGQAQGDKQAKPEGDKAGGKSGLSIFRGKKDQD